MADASSQATTLAETSQRSRIASVNLWWQRIIALGSQVQPAFLVGSVVLVPIAALHSTPLVGIYATAFALVLLVVLSLISIYLHKLAIVSAIIPVSYWIGLGMPQKSPLTQQACLYGGMLVLGLAYRHLFVHDKLFAYDKRRIKLRRRREYRTAFPLMIGLGLVLGAVTAFFLPSAPVFSSLPHMAMLLAVLCAVIEAIFFQGLLQSSAAQVMPATAALVLTAVIYSAMSAATLAMLPLALLTGLSFALIYFYRPHTAFVMTANVTAKLTLVLFMLKA